MGNAIPVSGHRIPPAFHEGPENGLETAGTGPALRGLMNRSSSAPKPSGFFSRQARPLSRWICLGLLAGAVACDLLQAADWPQWRGATRDGISAETDWSHAWPGGEPPLAWSAQIGKGLATAVAASGAVFAYGHQDGSNVVTCLGASDGAVRWRSAAKEELMDWQFEGGPCSTPLHADGRLFVAARSGRVQCLDAATGGILWERNLPETSGIKIRNWGLNGSPLLSGGRLILNYGTAGIALDPGDGSLLWKSGDEENTYTSPVAGTAGGREVLFVAGSERLALVDPVSGGIRWQRPFHVSFKAGDPVRTPTGVLFTSLEAGGFFLRLPSQGDPEKGWSSGSLGAVTGTPVLVGGFLYGIFGPNGQKGSLTCLEPDTGRVLWSRKGYGWGSLLAAGDRLITMTDKGEVAVLRASSKKAEVLASFQALGGKCWSAPVLADGRLFIRNAQGRLAAFDLRPAAGSGFRSSATSP
jgi:outer membrane protein assembly factor BamB